MRNQRIIRLGQSGEVRPILKKSLVRTIRCADLRGNRAVLAERIGSHCDAAADGSNDVSAGNSDAAEILRAIIGRNEIDGLAVGGKAWAAHTAVKCLCEDSRLTAVGRSDGEMLRGVPEEMRVDLCDVRNPFT